VVTPSRLPVSQPRIATLLIMSTNKLALLGLAALVLAIPTWLVVAGAGATADSPDTVALAPAAQPKADDPTDARAGLESCRTPTFTSSAPPTRPRT
jgi:hypothetical protein